MMGFDKLTGSGSEGEEKMKIKLEYVGKWRIIEMSEWDQDFVNLVAPGHLTINTDGTGDFAFGAFEAEIDCRVEKKGGRRVYV